MLAQVHIEFFLSRPQVARMALSAQLAGHHAPPTRRDGGAEPAILQPKMRPAWNRRHDGPKPNSPDAYRHAGDANEPEDSMDAPDIASVPEPALFVFDDRLGPFMPRL